MTVANIEAVLVVAPAINISVIASMLKILAFDIDNLTLLLEHMPYIHYPLYFQKNKKEEIEAFINFGNEINMITLIYIKKLGF